MSTSTALVVGGAFLASGVEMVEALTIVLGVGVVRGWRSTLAGVEWTPFDFWKPKLFAGVVKKEFLPEERALGCDREYAQLAHAFTTLIGPHIDKALARKLHKRWLPPVTTPKPRRGPEQSATSSPRSEVESWPRAIRGGTQPAKRGTSPSTSAPSSSPCR